MAANESTSFLKLNRKFFSHYLWNEERVFSKAEAWLDLIRSAGYDEENKMVIRGHVVTWGRGEIVGSLRYFSNRWKWSKDRVSRFFEALTRENMIQTRTATDRVNTIITLCNYISYNVNGKNDATETRHQQATGKDSGKDTDKDKIKNIRTNKELIKNNTRTATRSSDLFAPLLPSNEKKQEYQSLLAEVQEKPTAEIFTTIRKFITDNRPDFPEPYFDLWNMFALKLGLIKEPSAITKYRKQKFQTRIKEPGFDFVKILEKVKKSDFYRGEGRTDGRNWKVGISWILESEENYTKILESE